MCAVPLKSVSYYLSMQYMAQGDCFIVVYSITDRRSFEEAQSIFEWIKRIRDKEMPVVSEWVYAACHY